MATLPLGGPCRTVRTIAYVKELTAKDFKVVSFSLPVANPLNPTIIEWGSTILGINSPLIKSFEGAFTVSVSDMAGQTGTVTGTAPVGSSTIGGAITPLIQQVTSGAGANTATTWQIVVTANVVLLGKTTPEQVTFMLTHVSPF